MLVRVRFERHCDVALVIHRPKPEVTSILQARSDRNARLINPVTFDYAVANLDAQRVLFYVASLFRVRQPIVPVKRERVIGGSIAGITFPTAAETDGVGRLFKTAVANQLRMQSA